MPLGPHAASVVSLLAGQRTAVLACHALSGAGISHAVIKGLATALTLHHDPLARPFRDVDLYVAWPDLARARRALLASGFREVGLSNAHAAVLASPLAGAPDLDLHGWLGYPLVPRGGAQALLSRAVWLPVQGGRIAVAASLDLACLSALFAVRDRLGPSTSALLGDVRIAAEKHGRDALSARARELGLERVTRMAIEARIARDRGDVSAWARRLDALDRRYPRVLTAATALLLDGGRGVPAFGLSAAILSAETVVRRARRGDG
jgi:hypothetical protein